MNPFQRSGPVAVVTALALVGSATGLAAQTGIGSFTVKWARGLVQVEQGAVEGDDFDIAYQTLEFFPEGTSPTDDVAVEPEPLASRSGLTFSERELAVWRDRAERGPFKSTSDAWDNSPGDWDRLVANAERFLEDPEADRYPGPRTDGTCVQKWDQGPPYSHVGWLRDAAFVTLVSGGDRYTSAIRAELLWHARQPGLAFGNRAVWCPEVVVDVNPGFEIATFMTTMLYTYDYLGDDAFTVSEQALLDGWFGDAGRWFQQEIDTQFEKRFDVRELDEHVVTASVMQSPGCDTVSWYGGPTICFLQKIYNNRHATMARLVGAVGVHLGDADLIRSAKLFAIEFVKFSVFPDGTFGEFERWREELPDLGWGYATQVVGPVITIADLLARSGDTSLYDFETSEGAFGTEGGTKSILFAAQSLGRYVDGTYQRHGTDEASAVGPGTLIDGVNGSWDAIHDVVTAPANRYYRDPYLRSMYRRTGTGMRPYPANPTSTGPNQVWTGEHGTLPAILFMYADLEFMTYP